MKLCDTVFAHHHNPTAIVSTDGHRSNTTPCASDASTSNASRREWRNVAVAWRAAIGASSALLRRSGFRRLVRTLLLQFSQVFDWRVVVLFDLGDAQTDWIDIGLFGFCARFANSAFGLPTHSKRDELLPAGETFEVVPFLARNFLLAGFDREVHVAAFGRGIGVAT